MKIDPTSALQQLRNHDKPFKMLFQHGSMELEIYKPDQIDKQQPHTRDEIYIIIAGSGHFLQEGEKFSFEAGDFFFVAAGEEHKFIDFSDDFSTWVIFYGPEGGE